MQHHGECVFLNVSDFLFGHAVLVILVMGADAAERDGLLWSVLVDRPDPLVLANLPLSAW